MPEKLNVALIGYGLAGKSFHAPLIGSTSGLELCSVMSSDPAKVHADRPAVKVVPSASEAFGDPEIDLVVIATPDRLHASQAMAALDCGKHVIIDKPFAATLPEAEAIADQAAESGKFLSVFHNRRWDSDFLTLQRLVAMGRLGEVVHFESHFDRHRPDVLDRWRDQAGAGIWKDLGPHLVDQALQLFGPPLAIYADLGCQRPRAVAVDYFHVLLRYERLRVILHGTQTAPVSDLRFVVHGTEGSFIKYGSDPQERDSKEGKRPGEPGWGVDPRPGTLSRIAADGGVQEEPFDSVPGDYPAYYASVRDCILLGSGNPVCPEEALAVMRILDAGERSASDRREITLG